MDRNTTHSNAGGSTSIEALTPIEALFLSVGLPAVEVEACPVADCEVCHHAVPQAA